MKCNELMKKDVARCRIQDTVAEVAATMRDRAIGFLPVCDASDRVIGTITDRDLAVRVIAARMPCETTLVEEVMSRDVVACAASDELSVAEQRMSEHKKSRIVCTDEQGKPIGVISLSDLAEVEQSDRAANVLRSVAQREARV